MEARSTKHSARVDDALAAKAPSISNVVLETAEPPLPGALGEDERRRRSELAIALRPSCFPAQREQLLLVAQAELAPTWVIELLEALPIETRFDTVQDIWDVVGGRHEERDAIAPDEQPEAASEHEPPLSSPSETRGAIETDRHPALPSQAPAPIRIVSGIAAAGIGLGINAVRTAASLGRRVVAWARQR